MINNPKGQKKKKEDLGSELTAVDDFIGDNVFIFTATCNHERTKQKASQNRKIFAEAAFVLRGSRFIGIEGHRGRNGLYSAVHRCMSTCD